MNPERWEQIKQIYHSALELEPGRREVYLKEACAEDESLFKEVASLLAQEGSSGGLFESPAFDAVAQALAQDQAQKPQENLIGQTLSHYRIEGKIGEGGMGVVFLAQDSSLHRKVALKFLPPEMQKDALARKRFLREARSAAALDNPYICSIHEVGEFEGRDFIVMEYVDGQMLTDKLRRGRLPLNQALQIAAEVSEALQTAHSKGIIHRDLKPSNIMIMKTGHAMVMDFGLAKQIVSSAGIESQEESATEMTRSGMTLGTLAYMSPEQLRGEEVDARSDIFSFGLVLYEMLTGTHPFRKESPMETASAILHEKPKPVNAITKGIPADLEKLIARCLRKEADRRIQHMGDVKLALLELKEGSDSREVAPEAPATTRGRSYLLFSAILVAAAVFAVAAWLWLGRSGPALEETMLTPIPLTSDPGTETYPSFSPDGTQVAYQGCPDGWLPGKNCDIYVKQIGLDPPSRLTDTTEQEVCPAWSPDGRFIAFLRKLSAEMVQLILIPQRGGRERELAKLKVVLAPSYQDGLAWTPDSKWVVTPASKPGENDTALYLISIETGEKKQLTDPPRAPRVHDDTSPAFSPDGRVLAFARMTGDGVAELRLLRTGEGYSPQGEPERVRSKNPINIGAAWTPDGRGIVVSSTSFQPLRSGLWRVGVSVPGEPRIIPFAQDSALTPAISRLGNRLAYSVERTDTNIWRVDLRGPDRKPGVPSKFIYSTRADGWPTFSPDGKRIAFFSARSGDDRIWVCDSDGSNPVQLNARGLQIKWSPDGQSIVFSSIVGDNQDLYVISANGGAPRRLTSEPGGDQWPFWSRDSQAIFFKSSRSGTHRSGGCLPVGEPRCR